jgi:hypothetical protein
MTGRSARTFEQINVAAKNAAARHLIVFSIFHTPRGYEMAAIPLDFDLPVTKKWLHLCRKLRTRLSATEWLRPDAAEQRWTFGNPAIIGNNSP